MEIRMVDIQDKTLDSNTRILFVAFLPPPLCFHEWMKKDNT